MNHDYVNRMMVEKEAELHKRKEHKRELYVDGTSVPNLTQKISKNNKTGVKGVRWDRSRLKWAAHIYFKGKCYQLGRFDDINDAIEARRKKEEELFGPYKRGNLE